METFIVCTIVIILTIIFVVLCSKLSFKLELKSQYEQPIPNNLHPATEEEKDLLRQHFTMAGTINGGKTTTNLVNEWCKSLYVAYGTVIDTRDSVIVGYDVGDLTTRTHYATIEMDGVQFEIELKDAIINDKVIVFYSKDNKGQMVYRFAIRKEKQNETK